MQRSKPDFSKVLFRCSSLGHLMTSPVSKEAKANDDLSEGAKKHLMDKYVSVIYGRKTEINTKYTNKGLQVEEDSITLYSRRYRSYFKKNEQTISNDYIQGTPDMFIGESIKNAEKIIDVKSSWDLFTFFRTLTTDMKQLYKWQLLGYMGLSGAKSAELGYCLINTPEPLINDEKRKLMWKMAVATDEDPMYLEACKEIDLNMTYDDIPLHERVISYTMQRNDDELVRLYKKIDKARAYLEQIYDELHPAA